MDAIEQSLDLNRFAPYAQASVWLKQAGFFVAAEPAVLAAPVATPVIADIQGNLKRLGYKVPQTGRMDEATRHAVASYARKRRLLSTDNRVVLASLCKDLQGVCSKASRIDGQ